MNEHVFKPFAHLQKKGSNPFELKVKVPVHQGQTLETDFNPASSSTENSSLDIIVNGLAEGMIEIKDIHPKTITSGQLGEAVEVKVVGHEDFVWQFPPGDTNNNLESPPHLLLEFEDVSSGGVVTREYDLHVIVFLQANERLTYNPNNETEGKNVNGVIVREIILEVATGGVANPRNEIWPKTGFPRGRSNSGETEVEIHVIVVHRNGRRRKGVVQYAAASPKPVSGLSKK